MVLLLAAWSMPGCATDEAARSPGAVDELQRPPDDFTLDAVILTGPRVPDQGRVELRPGHFILLADGSLLHDSGPSVSWSQRPGRVRMLYQQQVADLWRLARDLGFTNPANADFTGNPALVIPERGETIHILALSANGERWIFARSMPAGADPDPAFARILRALAELAWSRDPAPDRFLPIRYDFGPNPYTGFRRRAP